MEHDLQTYRANLMRTPSYCACPVFLSGVGWQVEDSGDVLVDKLSNANTVAIVVGRVSNQRFFVTPNGNYGTANKFGDISKSKFLFIIGKPMDTPFAGDFDKALDILVKIQNQMASTPKRLNLITSDGRNKFLRFTRNVFEQRVKFETLYSLHVVNLFLGDGN